MKYIILLISIIIFAHSPWAQAAGERYRVEVLVLKHLENSEQAEEVKRIEDYSSALDFLTPVVEDDSEPGKACEPMEEEVESTLAAGEAETTSPAAGLEAGQVPADNSLASIESEEIIEEEVDPNAVVQVEEMGPEMQDAWRRLRLSGPFRPLQYLSWEQGSEEPFPVLRLHDLDVVLVDDPYSDLRAAEDEFAETYGNELPADDPGPGSDTACEEPEVDPLPEPTLYYALDGTVSMVRTRFLHLNLDLQLRAALFEPEPGDYPPLAQALSPGEEQQSDPQPPQPSGFLLHELVQKRQVRSARMEYFDGPVIGVLAWITSIPLEDAAER